MRTECLPSSRVEAFPTMGPDLVQILQRESCMKGLGLIAGYYNNDLDNIGNHDSYVSYGPR